MRLTLQTVEVLNEVIEELQQVQRMIQDKEAASVTAVFPVSMRENCKRLLDLQLREREGQLKSLLDKKFNVEA